MLVDLAQAEYLEIRRSRSKADPVQPMKSVQAAQIPHQLIARPQVEVIRIGQDQLDLELFQVTRGDSLDRSRGAYRREYGGGNISVRGLQDSGSCLAIGRDQAQNRMT